MIDLLSRYGHAGHVNTYVNPQIVPDVTVSEEPIM